MSEHTELLRTLAKEAAQINLKGIAPAVPFCYIASCPFISKNAKR